MQQYFLNEELNVESTYELSKDDSNHIVRIMRKKLMIRYMLFLIMKLSTFVIL